MIINNFSDLEGKFQDKCAIIICGGPSVLEYINKISNLDQSRYTILVEAKAITPLLLSSGVRPDYILVPYANKLIDNGLQHFIYRSFLANRINISFFLKKKYLKEYYFMRNNFDKLFNIVDTKKKIKRIIYKKNIFLENSPLSLIKNSELKNIPLITNIDTIKNSFPDINFSNPIYNIVFKNTDEDIYINNRNLLIHSYLKKVDQYFNSKVINNNLNIIQTSFLNSNSSFLYSLINFMGFKKSYALGMDMNMLGQLEFSAHHSFKSMLHFYIYFRLTAHVFNGNYVINKPYYLRPKSEFDDLLNFYESNLINLDRVVSNTAYEGSLNSFKEIRFDELLN